MADVVRTPDDRFADLPDWQYPPTYTTVRVDGLDLRLAHVEVGPTDGHPIVLLHGEPTWGFLYRHVLPPLVEAGHRAIVPDQVGFGRSDKPQPRDWYSWSRLAAARDAHLDALLGDTVATLVVHDWGGLLGLPWAAANPDRVARVVVMNTGLYRSGGRMSDAWWHFRDRAAEWDTFPVGRVIDGACLADLAPGVLAAYEAPFPDPSSHGAPLAMPLLVPTDDTGDAAAAHLAAWEVFEGWQDPPMLFLWGARDPILPPRVAEAMAGWIPAALPVETVEASHFLQEDAGPELGHRIARFVAEDR